MFLITAPGSLRPLENRTQQVIFTFFLQKYTFLMSNHSFFGFFFAFRQKKQNSFFEILKFFILNALHFLRSCKFTKFPFPTTKNSLFIFVN